MKFLQQWFRALRSGIDGVSLWIEKQLTLLDARTIVGLSLLALGASIVARPDVGTAATIGAFGISPVAFGYGALLAGGIILRFPGTRAYTLLLLPLLFYVGAFGAFLHYQNTTSLAPLTIHVAFVLLAYKAESKDAG